MAVPNLCYASGNSASTTLSSSMTNSDTTASITSDTNFNAKSGAGMVLLDEGEATEELAYATGKSGSTLTIPLANRGAEGGSAQAHASGASVKGVLTAGMWNDLIDSVVNVCDATTGALDTTKVTDLTTAQTLTNKTLTTPVIASFYQDAGKTKLMTTPNTASDTLAAIAATQTLTNKRITKRVVTVTQSATPTINTDNTDVAYITGLAQAVTSFTTNLSGTPANGDSLIISITDDGTGRALTFGTSFEASGNVALPTTTVASTRLDIGFLWNTATSKWRCVASS